MRIRFQCGNSNIPVSYTHLSYKYYGGALGIGILLFAITTLAKGGFKEAYNTVRQKAYLCASTTSMYTNHYL